MLYGSQWDPPDEVQENVRKYVDEVARILKVSGKWLYITFRQPHFVKPQLLREEAWDVVVEHLEDGPGTFEYFAYVMTKHGHPTEKREGSVSELVATKTSGGQPVRMIDTLHAPDKVL
jgi:hypothetical protein